MPATAARIGFIREQWRRAVSETPAVRTRYGALARQSEDPVETWFDSEADAQVMADARQALLSPERRRFRVTVNDAEEILALPVRGTVPVARYLDVERDADREVLIDEIVVDLGRNSAVLMVWG